MQKTRNRNVTLAVDIVSIISIILIPIILYEGFHSPLPTHQNVPLRLFMLDAPLACFGFIWLISQDINLHIFLRLRQLSIKYNR